MKTSLAISVCLFFAVSIFAQNAEIAENDTVKVESIALMRDDGEGKPGDETETFKTTDAPIYFQVTLDSFKASAVALKLAAVEVKGLKAGTKILTINYKTDDEQNIINFRGSPKGAWLAGKYRVDVFIDSKIAGQKEFEIVKAASSAAAQKRFVPKPKYKN